MFSNKKTILAGTVIVYLLLMLVFTFVDLKAELLIYHPGSTFGRCFEIVGTLPMPTVAVFTCMALMLTNRRKRTLRSVLSYIGILGMHYATDVITGAMITIFTMQAMDAFIMRQPNEVQRRMLWTRIKWTQFYMK